jgi:hypothetical protein
MENKELDEKMTNTELSDVQVKLERQKQDNEIMKEKIDMLTKHYSNFQEVLGELEQGRKIKIKKRSSEESKRIKNELIANIKNI